MASGDFDPGFFINHMIKDLKTANSEAETNGLDMRIAKNTLAHLKTLESAGQGEPGTQALLKYYTG